jgi:serine/threonine protein kinase
MSLLADRYDIAEVVGAGSYGNVFKARHKLTGVQVAVKMIPKSLLQKPTAMAHFNNEVRNLRPINHPLIVRLADVIEEQDSFYLVFEFSPNRDLLDHVNKTGGMPEDECRAMFSQLVAAVSYLHEERRLVHRDLKLENIMLDRNGNIRVIDFGFSKAFSDREDVFSSRCGSPAYVAPEVITGRLYTASVDVWSLGVVLYAMSVGHLPFEGPTTDAQLRKIAFVQPRYPCYLSSNLVTLLTGMLEKNGSRRLTLDQVRQHPWLDGFDRGQWSRVSPDPDPEVIQRVGRCGLQITEKDVCDDVQSDGVVCYKILEREKVTSLRAPPDVVLKTPTRAPIIQSSPMTPSKRPEVRSLWTPTKPKADKENEAAQANCVLSPLKSPRTPTRADPQSPRRTPLK